MSDAFAAALSALHADPNLSSAATWSRGGSSAALRVVLSAPDAVQSVAGPGVVAPDAMAHIRIGDLPQTPRVGDTLTVGATTYTIASPPQRDPEGVTWLVALRGAAATTTAGTALAGAVP